MIPDFDHSDDGKDVRRFCGNCGSPHPPKALFCPSCGKKLHSETTEPFKDPLYVEKSTIQITDFHQVKSKQSRWVNILLIVLILLFSGVIAIRLQLWENFPIDLSSKIPFLQKEDIPSQTIGIASAPTSTLSPSEQVTVSSIQTATNEFIIVQNSPTPYPTSTRTTTPSHTPTSTMTSTPSPSPENYDLAFASDQDGEFAVYLMNSVTGDFLKLDRPEGYDRILWPSFCGDEIAVEAQDTTGLNPQWIYFYDTSGRVTVSLETPTGIIQAGVPRCQPTSEYIAYSGSQGGAWYMFVWDGDEHYRYSPGKSGTGGYASWPLTGINFIFQVIDSSFNNLIYQNLGEPENGRYQQIRQGGNPAISPDGTLISYSCKKVGKGHTLCITDIGGSEVKELTSITWTKTQLNWGPQPVSFWSKDGNWIYYASADDGDYDIYRIRPDGSGEENLTEGWDSSHEIMPAISW